MKTLTGYCESSKEISLSKATRIFSEFVAADNGASHVMNAFLHRASAAFNDLNQLHKELKPAQSHRKNRGSHITDDRGKVVELHDSEKLFRNDVKLDREVSGSVVGGSEKRDKKDGKMKIEFGDSDKKNGIELGLGEEGREEEGKKQKKEKKNKNVEVENAKGKEQQKKMEKNISNNAKVENEGIVGSQELEIRSKKRNEAGSEKVRMQKEKNLEVENVKGREQQKEVEKKLSNDVKSENGGVGGSRDLENRSKKKHEAGSGNKLHAEEGKTDQRKKRKNENVEERSGEKSKKKMKRKHEG